MSLRNACDEGVIVDVRGGDDNTGHDDDGDAGDRAGDGGCGGEGSTSTTVSDFVSGCADKAAASEAPTSPPPMITRSASMVARARCGG